MPFKDALKNRIAEIGWGVFLILLAAVIFVVAGYPLGPITILLLAISFLFAYAYPYAAFVLFIFLIPFQGIYVSIPIDIPLIGERVFGGSADLLLGEVVAVIVLVAWGIRTLAQWIYRQDSNWKPQLPLFWPMMGIVATHLLSSQSSLHPDVLLVIKYTIRPIFWCYIAYVAFPLHVIRSRRSLRVILGTITITGLIAAFMGFISLWFPQTAGQPFPRAVPLPVFGISVLGDNHNLLAEWFVVSVSCTIALSFLTKSERLKGILKAAALFQAVIALLTFARTLWIVFAFEGVVAAWLLWRSRLQKYLPMILIAATLLLPLTVLMTTFSASSFVQSSTSTRVMLTQIALNIWSQSPWIGAGAGTFVDRIGATTIFLIEYGAPLDSHGWIQKLLAEVGLIGLTAVLFFFWRLFVFIRNELRANTFRSSAERDVFLLLALTVYAEALYQCFNTNYWSGKLWLPIGLLFVASRVLGERKP
jgi:hypothetical protein